MKRMKRFTACLTAAVMLAMQSVSLPSPKVLAAPDEYHDDWLHVEGDKIVFTHWKVIFVIFGELVKWGGTDPSFF